VSIYNNKKTLFNKLKRNSKNEWLNYTKHKFLNDLVSNKLSINKFKKYLLQDYIFLQQFLRILSLASYKSKDYADIYKATNFIISIKNELKLHVSFCRKWGISFARLNKIKPLKANTAYTDYALKIGSKDTNLELYTCLAPCIIGYGEIGLNLSKIKNWKKSKYNSWIKMYSSKEYQSVANDNIRYLDKLFKIEKKRKYKKLIKIFRKATILEKKFWDMI
jgi:thiaminase/transcriptional activator TenA